MTNGFTMVPNSLVRGEIRHPDGRPISDGARALYELILDYSRCGERSCTASQETLSRHLGVTVRRVRDRLRELEQLRLVTSERAGRAGTNTITPHLLPERKSASGRKRLSTSHKEDVQGEEDVSSTEGTTYVATLRREVWP